MFFIKNFLGYILFVIIFFLLLLYALYFYAKYSHIRNVSHFSQNSSISKRHSSNIVKDLPLALKRDVGYLYSGDFSRDGSKQLNQKKLLIHLGNSFTWGSEVEGMFSYPHQLDLMLKESMTTKNFGTPWYGGFQAYRLLEYLIKKQPIDILVTGPYLFERDKDLTFSTGFGTPFAGYFHGRYILDSAGKLKFINIDSGHSSSRHLNLEQRINFFPHLEELAYDYHAPYSLGLVAKILNLNFNNPFYDPHSWKEKRVYKKIVEQIFKEMRRDIGRVINVSLGDNSFQGVSSVDVVGVENLTINLPKKIPYWKLSHPSELGHEYIAKYLNNYIKGSKKIDSFLRVCNFKFDRKERKKSPYIRAFFKNTHYASLVFRTSMKEKFVKSDRFIVISSQDDLINGLWFKVEKGESFEQLTVLSNGEIVNVEPRLISDKVFQINLGESYLQNGTSVKSKYFFYDQSSLQTEVILGKRELASFYRQNGKHLRKLSSSYFFKVNKNDLLQNDILNKNIEIKLFGGEVLSAKINYDCD